MSIQELYEQIGGNYSDAKARLSLDKLVIKFIQKFPADPNFEQLVFAWNNQDEKNIFSTSHTLKGVCANLSIDRLFETSSAICEAYRPGHEDLRASTDVAALIEKLKVDYADTVAKINAFAAEQK